MTPFRTPLRGIVISGASRGLGAALALRFAAPGRRLLLLARSAAALEAVAASCRAQGAEALAVPLDITDAAEVAAALAAFEAGGPIDLVIANAGISAGTTPDGAPEDAAATARQVAVNLGGAINLVAPLLPGMLARRSGQIGLVASIAGFRGLPDLPGYCASKAGLIAWGEALRAAHRRRGLRVSVITPGFFDSEMGDRFLGQRPFRLTLEAATTRIHAGLLRGDASIAFPWPMVLVLKLLSVLPARVSDAAVRLMRIRIVLDRRENGAPSAGEG